MKKILYLLLTSVVFISCGPILNTIYGVNKNRRFESKQSLADHYVKKNKLERERIYFFTSSTDRNTFLEETYGKGKIEYYGIQINDSIMVDDTQISRQWCMGVVGNIITDSTSYLKLKPSIIKNFTLVDIEGQPVNFNKEQPTVVFLLHTNAGRLINKNVGYVVNHIKENNAPVDYIYIATDWLPEYKSTVN